MVNAILDGKKTQTRRIIKQQPSNNSMVPVYCIESANRYNEGKYFYALVNNSKDKIIESDNIYFNCVYNIGDKLWVRETFAKSSDGKILYKADGHDVTKWTSPLFMKREYSRIYLKVTNIFMQRINDISDEDILREGVNNREEYEKLWNSIHGDGSWKKNKWVWILEFERIGESQ